MSSAIASREGGLNEGNLPNAVLRWLRLPPEAWSARRRFAIASLIAVAVCAVGGNAWLAADLGGEQAQRARLDEARQHLDEARRAVTQVPALRHAAAEASAFHDAAGWTPADDLRVLSQLASRSGVELLALEPQPVTGTGIAAVRPVRLTARANFASVSEFLRGLQSLPVLAVPSDISVKRSGGTLAISTTLDVFDALQPVVAQTGEGAGQQSDDDVLFYDPFSPRNRIMASGDTTMRLAGLLRDDRHDLAVLETADGFTTVARGDNLGVERVTRIGPLDITLASRAGTHTLALAGEATP